MKLSGVDKLFMEARNEELCILRKEVATLKKELAQRSDNSAMDAIAALRDLVSEVDYHKEAICYQTDHLDYCLTRAKDVLQQHQ
jgi:hypothetical protein